MPLISLDSHDSVPLTGQIIAAVKAQIDDRALRPGARMPSIRQFAQAHRVSRFTVVTAYDRLVAMGYLSSRQGSGFYVVPRTKAPAARTAPYKLDRAMDVLWLLRNALQQPTLRPMPGAGWLPSVWMDEAGIQRSLRALSRQSGDFLTGYGTPGGYLPLREILQHRLAAIGIDAEPSQIVLTKGATHALDLIARYFIRPGDTVLVDDPGYFILFGALKSLGAKIVGVPWKFDGPDTRALETLLETQRPKIFFTNTVLHNPTGSSISQAVAHRVLQLAEKHQLLIVEDDIYGDFHPAPVTRLATLDQLDRVIYIGSFSKTIAASLRVGFLVCKREIAEHLTDLKLLTGLTTSEIGERLIYQLLTDGYYRKHMDKLRSRLQAARQRVIHKLENIGFQIYREPEGGMFLWAKLTDATNVLEIATLAASKGIMLAPGNLFRPHQEPTPWLRFNVASSEEPATLRFLESVTRTHGATAKLLK
ncbi:MAG: aminotransferase-like domain-containing protein [Gammaproteobacteria bacterium]